MMIRVWIVAILILVPLKIAGDIAEHNRQTKAEHANQQKDVDDAGDEGTTEYLGGA